MKNMYRSSLTRNCNEKPAVFPCNMFYTKVHHLTCKYQLMFYTPSFKEVKFISLWCETKSSCFFKKEYFSDFYLSYILRNVKTWEITSCCKNCSRRKCLSRFNIWFRQKLWRWQNFEFILWRCINLVSGCIKLSNGCRTQRYGDG